MTQDRLHACHGMWHLIPELCFYESGEAPKSCVYNISIAEGYANFTLSWVQQDGMEFEIEFGGMADSIARDVDAPPGAQASYTIIDGQTLDSSMLIQGKEVAYARRRVSDDGQLMAVLQVNHSADGVQRRITQVYRRAD
ncbi:hypothetical protein [Vibrio sp.]|uniref:hypothetical protein n=1 Tax=Vibrio sp. TaxID=678 RepID=UPI003D0ADC1E